MGSDHEEQLATALLGAVAALGEGRATDAEPALAQVVDALRGEPDLSDVLARVLSLRAQAALALGDAAAAKRWSGEAAALLEAAGDGEGLAEVRALQGRAQAEIEAAQRAGAARRRAEATASLPIDEILGRTTDPLARADALIRHAGALRLAGRVDDARQSAELAVIEADRSGSVRERVLSRLALVETDPSAADPALLDALAAADRADEPTLIGLVARAAELVGLVLPTHRGPLEGRP